MSLGDRNDSHYVWSDDENITIQRVHCNITTITHHLKSRGVWSTLGLVYSITSEGLSDAFVESPFDK